MDFNCDICNREPSVKKRIVTPEEIAAANLEIERELPEHQKLGRRMEIARRLGVRVEDVKL